MSFSFTTEKYSIIIIKSFNVRQNKGLSLLAGDYHFLKCLCTAFSSITSVMGDAILNIFLSLDVHIRYETEKDIFSEHELKSLIKLIAVSSLQDLHRFSQL